MSLNISDQSSWEKEQRFLTIERKRYPEQFFLEKKSPEILLNRIGINEKMNKRPKGYVKYSPLDFIVEEIALDGTVIDIGDSNLPRIEDGIGTVYTDLVKVGISTLDAVARISSALEIDPKRIGYAGIKDAGALTGQRISIRGLEKERIEGLKLPNLILKNISIGKSVMNIGDLAGNRFTLFIRTEHKLNTEDFSLIIEKLKNEGVMNYYGIQRFGAPRFLAHLFGAYLLQGDSEGLIRTYFTKASPFEWLYVGNLRKQFEQNFGNWKLMRQIADQLPHTFRFERAMLDVLESDSSLNKYPKAITSIPLQADLWVKAYASFLANKVLSSFVLSEQKPPENIPLLLGFDPSIAEFYKDFLKQDGTQDFLKNLQNFPFIHIGRLSSIPSVIRPNIHNYKIVDEGLAISFDLPKAAYATTVLGSLFETQSDLPMPEWAKRREYDVKEILNLGSCSEAKNQLKIYIELAMNLKNSFGEE